MTNEITPKLIRLMKSGQIDRVPGPAVKNFNTQVALAFKRKDNIINARH